MDEKVVGRSGEFITEDGNPEFWWNGRNYGCILPEELIDAELVASNHLVRNGGNDYGLPKSDKRGVRGLCNLY